MMNFPVNLAVNGFQPVNQYGNYVYYKAGSAGGADPTIKVKTDGGDEYFLMPGQGFRLDKSTFTSLIITNYANAGTITGTLVIADGAFFDNRVIGTVDIAGVVSVNGTVTTIDKGHDRSVAGATYVAGVTVPAGGGQAFEQLWNPVGSGKNVIVSSFELMTNPSASLMVSLTTGALASQVANGVQNKNLGSAVAAVAQLRTQQGGTLTGKVKLFDLQLQSITTKQYKFSDPLIIRPGYGLLFEGSIDGAASVTGLFDFYEE